MWFLKEIPLWKKCLFSKVGYSAFPCQELRFSTGGKYFHAKCKRTWIMQFPTLSLLTSICQSWKSHISIYGISYFQRRKNFHLPKLEKPFLHIWLTTYPKAEFYISKERKIQWPWKIDFQTWICSMQRWNAYFLNVDNQENLNLVAC